MNLIRRNLKAIRRTAQKGFTLIELAIVGLFLGLLAIFAISQFSGSATTATRANALVEATGKIADNWALIAQSCGISTDITGVDLTGGAAAAKNNMDLLLGLATANSAYTTCISGAGVRPLSGVATTGATAADRRIQGYSVTPATVTVAGRNALSLAFAAVPEELVFSLFVKYSGVVGASAMTGVPTAADTSDNAIRFSTATTGTRTMTLIKSL